MKGTTGPISSLRRRAAGGEACDPGCSAGPAEPCREAPRKRSAAMPARGCRGASERPGRPRGGGSSAGTYPRPGAESPAPARASPGHPETVRAAAPAPWRASDPALVAACPHSPTPRKLLASEPSLRSSPSRRGRARRGHLTPPPAPGTAGRRASPPSPGAECPGGRHGSRQGSREPILSSRRTEPHRRRARPYFLQRYGRHQTCF